MSLTRMTRPIYSLLLLVALSLAAMRPALAVLKIDITEGIEAAVPIAVVPFRWQGQGLLPDADVSAIIASDLARSGQLAPVPDQDLIARPVSAEQVDFKTWRIAGIDHLVIGSVTLNPDKTFQVQFRLFDILKAEQSLGYSFNVPRNQLRAVAHRISDYIIEHLTGLKPVFDARISYITVERQTGKSVYKLEVADTDGYNPQTLLTSPEPIMSPRWSPDGKNLVYVSFENGRSEIFIHNIFDGKREKLAAFDGINGSPSWSPDGNYLALTLSKDGNPDIYVLDLGKRTLRRLTTHWGIDTEASWMPDSKTLVFTSSRSGKPQIYSIPLNGNDNPSRLTFDGNYNANAAVSPDGKRMVFINGDGNNYRVAVMELGTRSMQLLTDGPLDESPEFAPNGNMVIYASRRQGRGVLSVVTVDGGRVHRLALEAGDVREPGWSPGL
jgi:TolB protein